MKNRKTASGIISLTQEHRFQLVDGEGNKFLFVLDHGSPVQGPDLERLEHARLPVKVTYADTGMLNSHVAYDVAEL